jgi:subtilisin-like proprotein convertase family protein
MVSTRQLLVLLMTAGIAFQATFITGQPKIQGFFPTQGKQGSLVNIEGLGFDPAPSGNVVRFGANRAPVVSATVTSMVIVVPNGATYSPITVTTKGRTAYSRYPFSPTFLGALGVTATSFNSTNQFPVGSTPLGLLLTDLDGDGKSEIITANNGTNSVSILRNESAPKSVSFAAKLDVIVGNHPSALAAGDFDGDGLIDLAVANRDSGYISVLRNSSTAGKLALGSAATLQSSGGAVPVAVYVADIDLDGLPDVAAANEVTGGLSIFRNTTTDGSISFANAIGVSVPPFTRSIHAADMDGDGSPDIMAVHLDSRTLTFHRNSSRPGVVSFAQASSLPTGAGPSDLLAVDLDGDGRVDLVTANTTANSLSLFRNETVNPGTPSLVPKPDLPVSRSPDALAVGSLDGDGQVDLVFLTASVSPLSIRRNASAVGTIALASSVDFNLGAALSACAVGDIDGDGKSDVVVTASGLNSSVIVLKNGTPSELSLVRDAQPSSQTLPFGTTLSITAEVEGPGPIAYQWYFSPNLESEPDPIFSGTNSTLAIPAARPFNSGLYFLVATNSFASVTSSVATVRVKGFIQSSIDGAKPGEIVSIPPGEYREVVKVTRSVILRGESPTNTLIDGGTNGIVLEVSRGVDASLSGLSVKGGSNPLGVGGGIYNQGSLTVSNCWIQENSALHGAGVANAGFLRVVASRIHGNLAGDDGFGGGIFNSSGVVIIENSTLSANLAGSGGGIYNESGTNRLIRSTISGNSAQAGDGGGIFNWFDASTFLDGCTVTLNDAFDGRLERGAAGGLFNECGGTMSSISTLVAGNTAFQGLGEDVTGSLDSRGFNILQKVLLQQPSCSDVGRTNATDLLNVSVPLRPLQDNGGLTWTHALLRTNGINPAIDKGPLTDTGSRDQRGFARPSDGDGDAQARSDVGAYEYQNVAPNTTALFALSASEDVPLDPVTFSVWDEETLSSALTVTAFSLSPAVIPSQNLSVQGIGGNRSLMVRFPTNQFGNCLIAIVVSDGQLASTNTFALNINPVNDLPTISPIPNQIVGQNRSVTLPLFVGDIETAAGAISLTASSSNPELLPSRGIVFSGAGSTRSLILTPAANRSGETLVRIAVRDSDGGVVTTEFQLVVQAPPALKTVPTNLTTTNGGPAEFVGVADGDDLHYQWLLNGTNVLSGATNSHLAIGGVSTRDIGQYSLVITNFGGSVTSSAARLRITTFPTISFLGDQITVSGLAVGPIPFRVIDAETPAANLKVSASSSDENLVSPEGIVLGGAGTNRTITVTPVGGATGIANVAGVTIRLTVTDGEEGSNSRGFRLTVGRPVSIIENPPSSLTVTQGNNASLRVAAVGYGTLSYQWRFNGANISGATNSSLEFDYAEPSHSGSYSVSVAHEFGSIESSRCNLKVIVPPSIIGEQPQSIALYPGWNLISFQVGVFGFALPEFLAALDRPNALQEIWGYEAASRTWHAWKPSGSAIPPEVLLDKMIPGRGYWVRASQGTVATLVGAPWTGSNTLVRGWNLVGFPGATDSEGSSLALDSVFGENLSRLPQLWTFDGPAQRFRGFDSVARPPITELNSIEQGKGYWVYSLDGYVMSPGPVIALPGDTDISPLQTPEIFERANPRFHGRNPELFVGRMVNYAGSEDTQAGADLNGNGILDDPVTQDTLIFKEGVRVQTISIGNAGDGLVNWAFESSIPWLSVDVSSGVVSSESAVVNVSVDRSGLRPGTYANSVFAVQAGNVSKLVRVILKVPDIAGDYRGAATIARVNGKPISLGKVDLNLAMFNDSGELGGPAFRAAIDRERSLLFPRDVFMNGIFYQANDFSLTSGFEMPPADRNVPPYNAFSHTSGIGKDYADKDWNNDGRLDNQNPFPFSIRREITLLGKRKTPDRLEGTYVEAVQGMLPEGKRIYLEGTFALDRESLVPTRKSIYNGKSPVTPIQIGGAGRTSYTNSLVVKDAVVLEGVRVVSKVDFGRPSELEIFLITPSGQQVWLHRFGPSLNPITTFDVTTLRGAVQSGTWQIVTRWLPSGERGNFNGWELNLEGLVVYTLSGNVAVEEKGSNKAATDAAVILSGSNLLPQARTSGDGSFRFLGLTENDYFLNISKLGYYETNIFVRVTNSSVDLGTIHLRPLTNTDPFMIAAPYAGFAPLYVNFKLVVPPAVVEQLGGTVTATWDFGDGVGGLVNQAVSATISHTYKLAGVYEPRATLMGAGTSREFTFGELIVQGSQPNPNQPGNHFVFGGGFIGSIASPASKDNLIEVETTARGGVVFQAMKRDPAAFDVDRFPFRDTASGLPFNPVREDTDYFVQEGSPYFGVPPTPFDTADALYKDYLLPTYGGHPVPDRFRIYCTMGGAVFGEQASRVGDFILQVGRVEP